MLPGPEPQWLGTIKACVKQRLHHGITLGDVQQLHQ